MTNPKVSILIPSYNYARYLPEAIESVLAQDFENFELLISDDCSTDNSAEVIARFAARDSRIRFQIHSKNLGIAQNLNWCLSQARGEYIKFILSDDKLTSPSAIGKMVNLMESDSEISLVATASLLIGANSQVIGARNHFQRGVNDGRKTIVKCLTNPPNCIGEPTVVMFRKSEAAGGFDPKFRQIMDLEMWLRLLENGKFGYINEPLCAFRKHERQQTNVNRSRGDTEDETAWLVEKYLAKPWLDKMAARRIMFAQLHWLRKSPAAKTIASFVEMRRKLGSGWNAALWLRYKISRPFLNLQSSINKLCLMRSAIDCKCRTRP